MLAPVHASAPATAKGVTSSTRRAGQRAERVRLLGAHRQDSANSSPPRRATWSPSRTPIRRRPPPRAAARRRPSAQRVVDLLEVVEVDQQQRQARALAARLGQLPRQQLAQHAPVRQPGERVAQREPAHPLLGPPPRLVVDQRAGVAEEGAVRRPARRPASIAQRQAPSGPRRRYSSRKRELVRARQQRVPRGGPVLGVGVGGPVFPALLAAERGPGRGEPSPAPPRRPPRPRRPAARRRRAGRPAQSSASCSVTSLSLPVAPHPRPGRLTDGEGRRRRAPASIRGYARLVGVTRR